MTKYYPVSLKKLERATPKEVAFLLNMPISLSKEHYFFDKIKHLLDIPEQPKTLEEIKQEFDERFADLVVETRRKFAVSKQKSEYFFNKFCEKQNEEFDWAKRNGHFPMKLKISSTELTGSSLVTVKIADPTLSRFNYKLKKPNAINRWLIKNLFGIEWSELNK
jgi:hypothetical protein